MQISQKLQICEMLSTQKLFYTRYSLCHKVYIGLSYFQTKSILAHKRGIRNLKKQAIRSKNTNFFISLPAVTCSYTHRFVRAIWWSFIFRHDFEIGSFFNRWNEWYWFSWFCCALKRNGNLSVELIYPGQIWFTFAMRRKRILIYKRLYLHL